MLQCVIGQVLADENDGCAMSPGRTGLAHEDAGVELEEEFVGLRESLELPDRHAAGSVLLAGGHDPTSSWQASLAGPS